MSLFSPIQAILQAYDQPFFKRPPLASQNLMLQQQLGEWVHQIYFDQKKLNQLSVIRMVQHPLDSLKPNIACSIMYSIIRQKVQQVCKSIRSLIIDSYRKLMLKKQLNCDLKHSSDSWNMNFYKFRKANAQTNMSKVYGPIAHIVSTYHNSLLDSNKEVYDLWKLLYQCSEVKDLQFKTLQSTLNQLILEQLMQDYPEQQFSPREVMPTLSSYEKHEFIFKEMWGFQKRKLAVQFHPKNQQSVQVQKQGTKSKAEQNNMPRKVQKGKVLSPPKPIPISLRQVGVNTNKVQKQSQQTKISQKQLAKRKALDDEIHLVQLQQQVQGLDNQTRLKILKQLFDYKKQPWFHKQKQQTLASISNIILGNLTETQKQLIQKRIAHDQPLQIEIQDDSDGDNDILFQDQTQIDQQIIDEDEFTIQLEKIKGTLIEDRQRQQKIAIQRDLSRDGNVSIFSEVRHKLQKINENLQKTITDYSYEKNPASGTKSQRKSSKNIDSNIAQSKIDQAKNYASYKNSLTTSYAQPEKSSTSLQQQDLPELMPISAHKKKINTNLNAKVQQKKAPDDNAKKPGKKQTSSKQSSRQFLNEHEKQFLFQHFQKFEKHSQNETKYNFKLDDQGGDFKKQSLYQKLRKFYQLRALQELSESSNDTSTKKQSSNARKQKCGSDKQMLFGRNISLAALSQKFAQKDKALSNSLSSCITNGNMSSKLQKMSQQQIVDQIYQIAKEKQKRGNFKKSDIKLTYKKISYELTTGDQKSQIKITKGSICTDFQTANWLDELPEQAKYHFSQSTEYGQKLIDQPSEDLCEDDKQQQKKKKKKKKKKNKNKKQASDQNQNLQKASVSSINDQYDLQTLQQFKRKSVVDALDFKKMLSWPQTLDLPEYLQNSQQLQRIKQREFLMQKKLEQYEKSGQPKDLSKDLKIKKEILNEDELKIFKFLQNLQIKEENRQKCVVTEETLQKILYKRKQIRTKEIFQRLNLRTQEDSVSTSRGQNTNGSSKDRKNDLSNPQTNKPKNKKKRK